MFTMENLPIEVISYILEYLTYTDLQQFRLINKYFYNITVTVTDPIEIFTYKNADSLKCLLNSSRVFSNIAIYNQPVEFLMNHPTQTHLKLIKISDQIIINLTEVLNAFSSLQEIVFQNFDFEDAIIKSNNCYNNIKSLRIENCKITDYFLKKIFYLIPNIVSFSCTHNNMFCSKVLFNRYYSKSNVLINPSNQVFTYHCLAELMKEKAFHIKYLDLNNTRVDAEYLSRILSNEDLKLHVLNIKKVNIDMKNIIKLQPTITNLNLSCTTLSNEGFINLCQQLINLRVLDISETMISEECLLLLRNLTLLKELYMVNCINLNGRNLVPGICSQLIKLSLPLTILKEVLFKLTDTIFFNLNELDISYSSELDDKIVENICQCLRMLRVLKLSNCANITDAGLRYIHQLKGLRYLNLSENNNLSNDCLKYIVFQELRFLNIGNTKINNHGIDIIIVNTPSLEELNMKHVTIDKTEEVKVFAKLKRLKCFIKCSVLE